MSNSNRNGSPMARKVVILFFVVGIFVVAWTAGWFLMKGRIDTGLSRALASARTNGTDVTCSGRRITGFPFHFDLLCGQLEIERRESQSSFVAAGLRTTTLVYRPNHVLAEIAAPGAFSSPALGRPVALNWSLARLSVRTDFERLVLASFAADDVDAALEVGGIAVKILETHVAPADERSTKLAVSAGNLVLTPAGDQPLQAADLSLKTTIALPVERIGEEVAWRAGTEVPMLELELKSGAFAMHVAGPVRIDRSGRISGILTARAAGLERLTTIERSLAQDGPDDVQRIAAALASAFGLVGMPADLDGRPARSISITIKSGNAYAGFIPLGRIPPLF